MDFIGFTYNGLHSFRDLKIYRTSDGSRYNENLTATMTDKTADVPGGDGQYYFGTTFKNRTFNINYAFDKLNEVELQQLKTVFSGDGIHDLIFDELPYKVWSAKITGTASIKHLCFNDDNNQRVYKGEGSITFTCYYPYARTPDKLWVEQRDDEGKVISVQYLTRDGRIFGNYSEYCYPNRNEWEAASGLTENLNTVKGDVPTPFKLIVDFTGKHKLTSNSAIKTLTVNSKTITFNTPIKVQENDKYIWDSKTGLVYKDKIIYPYTGKGIQTLTPHSSVVINITGDDLVIDASNQYDLKIEYNYLYR